MGDGKKAVEAVRAANAEGKPFSVILMVRHHDDDVFRVVE